MDGKWVIFILSWCYTFFFGSCTVNIWKCGEQTATEARVGVGRGRASERQEVRTSLRRGVGSSNRRADVVEPADGQATNSVSVAFSFWADEMKKESFEVLKWKHRRRMGSRRRWWRLTETYWRRRWITRPLISMWTEHVELRYVTISIHVDLFSRAGAWKKQRSYKHPPVNLCAFVVLWETWLVRAVLSLFAWRWCHHTPRIWFPTMGVSVLLVLPLATFLFHI